MAQERRFSAKLKISTAAKLGKKYDVLFSKSSNINLLDPFLNSDDIKCVEGKLNKSFLNEELKFSIILPKEERVATLIIQGLSLKMCTCRERINIEGTLQ